ncbi:MAG: hypothetical protein ACRDV9_10955 [Acidimicrobiia bacterium]
MFSPYKFIVWVGLYQRYGGLAPQLLYAATMVVVLGSFRHTPEAPGKIASSVTAGTTLLAGYILVQSADLGDC